MYHLAVRVGGIAFRSIHLIPYISTPISELGINLVKLPLFGNTSGTFEDHFSVHFYFWRSWYRKGSLKICLFLFLSDPLWAQSETPTSQQSYQQPGFSGKITTTFGTIFSSINRSWPLPFPPTPPTPAPPLANSENIYRIDSRPVIFYWSLFQSPIKLLSSQ